MMMNSTLPLAQIKLSTPEDCINNIKQHIAKGLESLDTHPLLKASLKTVGTAVIAAKVGCTVCAPLKTMNLNLAGGRSIELNRIISSLTPKQLLPHFRAIATNNLTLLMPQLFVNALIEKIPGPASLSKEKKTVLANLSAATFCTTVFLNQGIMANNRLARGIPANLNTLATERGKTVLVASALAFLTREVCGLTGLTTQDNPNLVKTVTTIATLADLAFANLSVAGPTKLPTPLQAGAYCVSRSFEASLYFQASKQISSSIGNSILNFKNENSQREKA